MALQLQLCIFNLYTNWVVKIYKRKLTKMGPGGQNVVLEVNYRQRLCLRLPKGNLRALQCLLGTPGLQPAADSARSQRFPGRLPF